MVNHPKVLGLIVRGLRTSARLVLVVLFCIFYVSVFAFNAPIFADAAADLAFIRKFNPIVVPERRAVIRFNPRETSELKLAATGLVRLYQKFISSQDAPACNFQPTCSRFGMACIQEYGVVRGIFLTADRLLRCNGSQPQYYHKDSVTGKYIDPVSDYATLK